MAPRNEIWWQTKRGRKRSNTATQAKGEKQQSEALAPHGREVSRDDVQSLNRILRDLVEVSGQSFQQHLETDHRHPLQGHFERLVLPLARQSHLQIHLPEDRGGGRRGRRGIFRSTKTIEMINVVTKTKRHLSHKNTTIAKVNSAVKMNTATNTGKKTKENSSRK